MNEFDSMDGFVYTNKATSPTRKIWIIALLLSLVAFGLGLLIGALAICKSETPQPLPQPQDGVFLPGVTDRIIQEANLSIRNEIMENINKENIEKYLRELTKKPHIAGSKEDKNLVDYIRSFWLESGLDTVQVTPYNILLSYPDTLNPNYIELVDDTNTVIYRTPIEEDILTPNTTQAEGIPPFNAYSPKGVVEGNLVYVNYGRVEDFVELEKANISVNGSIVISRYGKIFRGSKVAIAARHGAIGVILFSDPEDVTIPGEPLYPNGYWLPGSGAQRGTIFSGSGDPLTPGYPAIETAYRYEEDKVEPPLPRIPAHPIGYTVAQKLLENLGGDEVPESWRGGINVTYRYGPQLINNNRKVRMNISTINVRRNDSNVIGIIRGEVEPDRYVMLGNHRDAWVYGAIDPSSGTAVMMEISRVMGELVKTKKWRPRRSIMFCSWGAEEYGLIGSTEYVEQYIKNLKERAVAYINIDIAVLGTSNLYAGGTPLMYRPVYEASKQVPNPNPEEVAAGRKTMYDTWLYKWPLIVNGTNYNRPIILPLASGSDYAPILQKSGITSLDLSHTIDKDLPVDFYPLYHSQYETFYAVKNILDPTFEYHRAMARLAGEVTRNVADSLILPFDVSDYASTLESLRIVFDRENGELMRQNVDNYDDLKMVVDLFREEVINFEDRLQKVDKNNPLATRLINDQLSLLENAFLDPNGLPSRPLKKHILMAESSNDAYAGSSFPGLVDLLFEVDKNDNSSETWDAIKQHFSVVLFTIQSVASTLRDVAAFH